MLRTTRPWAGTGPEALAGCEGLGGALGLPGPVSAEGPGNAWGFPVGRPGSCCLALLILSRGTQPPASQSVRAAVAGYTLSHPGMRSCPEARASALLLCGERVRQPGWCRAASWALRAAAWCPPTVWRLEV